MSSAAAFSSRVLVAVAFLVWPFCQKMGRSTENRSSSPAPMAAWLAGSLEGLAEGTPNTWPNLLAWLETSSGSLLPEEKGERHSN